MAKHEWFAVAGAFSLTKAGGLTPPATADDALTVLRDRRTEVWEHYNRSVATLKQHGIPLDSVIIERDDPAWESVRSAFEAGGHAVVVVGPKCDRSELEWAALSVRNSGIEFAENEIRRFLAALQWEVAEPRWLEFANKRLAEFSDQYFEAIRELCKFTLAKPEFWTGHPWEPYPDSILILNDYFEAEWQRYVETEDQYDAEHAIKNAWRVLDDIGIPLAERPNLNGQSIESKMRDFRDWFRCKLAALRKAEPPRHRQPRYKPPPCPKCDGKARVTSTRDKTRRLLKCTACGHTWKSSKRSS